MRTPALKTALAALLLCLLRPVVTAAADPADEPAARAAIAARLDSLASLRVEYDIEEQATPPVLPAAQGGPPPPPNPAGILARWPKPGVQRSTGKFSFLKGMSRFETRPSQESIDADLADRILPFFAIVRTFRPDAAEQLVVAADGIRGHIGPPNQPPLATPVVVALGYAAFDEGQWFNPDALRAMEFARDKDGRIVLSRNEPHDLRSEFVIDPAKAHALVACRILVKEPGPPVVEITCDQFKPVAGVTVPHVIHMQRYHPGFKQVVLRWKATITKCDVNAPANNEDHYYIAWPQGTEVADARPDHRRHRKIQHEGEKIKD